MKQTMRILLIDDDVDLCQILGVFLEEKGYFLTYVNNWQDAIEVLSDDGFDLILLDENLQSASGLELIETFQRHNPHTPIIILSGYDSQHLRNKAAEMGAIGCIVKDIEVQQIIPQIESVMRKHLTSRTA